MHRSAGHLLLLSSHLGGGTAEALLSAVACSPPSAIGCPICNKIVSRSSASAAPPLLGADPASVRPGKRRLAADDAGRAAAGRTELSPADPASRRPLLFRRLPGVIQDEGTRSEAELNVASAGRLSRRASAGGSCLAPSLLARRRARRQASACRAAAAPAATVAAHAPRPPNTPTATSALSVPIRQNSGPISPSPRCARARSDRAAAAGPCNPAPTGASPTVARWHGRAHRRRRVGGRRPPLRNARADRFAAASWQTGADQRDDERREQVPSQRRSNGPPEASCTSLDQWR